MNLQTSHQDKTSIITPGVLSGAGITIFSLLIGTILDHIAVQGLSPYFFSDCSEDCYFAYFNAIFYVMVLLSLVVGLVGGSRTLRRLVERSK